MGCVEKPFSLCYQSVEPTLQLLNKFYCITICRPGNHSNRSVFAPLWVGVCIKWARGLDAGFRSSGLGDRMLLVSLGFRFGFASGFTMNLLACNILFNMFFGHIRYSWSPGLVGLTALGPGDI